MKHLLKSEVIFSAFFIASPSWLPHLFSSPLSSIYRHILRAPAVSLHLFRFYMHISRLIHSMPHPEAFPDPTV